jgi:hypothetical protein
MLVGNRSWRLKDSFGKLKKKGKMVELLAGREYTLSVELNEPFGKGSWTIFLGLEQELQAMETVDMGVHPVFLTFEAPYVKGE